MTLAPFDPLVADVLCSPATFRSPEFDPMPGNPECKAFMRRGVLYLFTLAEVRRAEAYFLHCLEKDV
jgi:hypothetical protein